MYDSNYHILRAELNDILKNAESFVIMVTYISSRGNNLGSRYLYVKNEDINSCKEKISLEENKINYSKLLKEEMKAELAKKQKEYYNFVNEIIDYANKSKNSLIIKGDTDALDNLIGRLFDRTVNSIKKIKVIDSEEWTLIKDFISNIKNDVEKIVTKNQKIFQYYESDDFLKIKKTCEALMDSQKEFNEYINEKVQTISQLFGTRVVRNETIIDDEYNYIRPYKKTITPFTAEVSAAVFASAENNPLDYVVKYFYPNKSIYKEQIEKLYHLIEELETLREAKQIIENYKEEYKQYLTDVPEYIMKNDESGFYSRLGFAIIDENTLTIEYKFSYTSNGGFVQRSFTIPMTEEIIIELIKTLENKLTIKEFVKEQRLLMTKKLREFIKGRDNFTCCNCGNSIHKEPNLLLEIDHIIPVSKGGTTTEDNLQTLCWKCNRAKSNKII
ncbi:MAG: HNH endonuclease [Fusobacterium sp.]